MHPATVWDHDGPKTDSSVASYGEAMSWCCNKDVQHGVLNTYPSTAQHPRWQQPPTQLAMQAATDAVNDVRNAANKACTSTHALSALHT
jgi:hypothetical protein